MIGALPTLPVRAAWSGAVHPLASTEVVIVDPGTCPACATDAVGEIWVRSPSVGGGYWRQSDASADNFQARLAASPTEDSEPFLRTGDLGFLHRGELFITGRRKDLVIVHGENHYPQDLEWTAEHAHAALRVGHGAAFAVDTEDGEGLVLALEMERRASLTEAPAIARAVRRAIGRAHALPVQTVVLMRSGALPRTSSGKIQRQRCRTAWLDGELDALAISDRLCGQEPADGEAPAAAGLAPVRAGHVMPRNAIEQALWDIWREVLDTRAFGVHEGFFELGGNSLMVTRVMSRITDRLGVELPMAALFEHESIAALAEQATAALARPADALPLDALPPMVRVRRGRALPVSLSQRRMWVIQQFDPRSTAYNVAVPMHLRGFFDPVLLQRSVDLLVARHEALRTCLIADADGPTQWIEPAL